MVWTLRGACSIFLVAFPGLHRFATVHVKQPCLEHAPPNAITNAVHSWLEKNPSLDAILVNLSAIDAEILRNALMGVLPSKEGRGRQESKWIVVDTGSSQSKEVVLMNSKPAKRDLAMGCTVVPHQQFWRSTTQPQAQEQASVQNLVCLFSHAHAGQWIASVPLRSLACMQIVCLVCNVTRAF